MLLSINVALMASHDNCSCSGQHDFEGNGGSCGSWPGASEMSLLTPNSVPHHWCYVLPEACSRAARGLDLQLRFASCSVPSAAPTPTPTTAPTKAPTPPRPYAVLSGNKIEQSRISLQSPCACSEKTPAEASQPPYNFPMEYGSFCSIWDQSHLPAVRSRSWCYVHTNRQCMWAKTSDFFDGWSYAFCKTTPIPLPTPSPTLAPHKMIPPPCASTNGILHCGGKKDNAGEVQLVIPRKRVLENHLPSPTSNHSRNTLRHAQRGPKDCKHVEISLNTTERLTFSLLKGGLNGLPVYKHRKQRILTHQQTDYLYFFRSSERSQWMVSDAVGSQLGWLFATSVTSNTGRPSPWNTQARSQYSWWVSKPQGWEIDPTVHVFCNHKRLHEQKNHDQIFYAAKEMQRKERLEKSTDSNKHSATDIEGDSVSNAWEYAELAAGGNKTIYTPAKNKTLARPPANIDLCVTINVSLGKTSQKQRDEEVLKRVTTVSAGVYRRFNGTTDHPSYYRSGSKFRSYLFYVDTAGRQQWLISPHYKSRSGWMFAPDSHQLPEKIESTMWWVSFDGRWMKVPGGLSITCTGSGSVPTAAAVTVHSQRSNHTAGDRYTTRSPTSAPTTNAKPSSAPTLLRTKRVEYSSRAALNNALKRKQELAAQQLYTAHPTPLPGSVRIHDGFGYFDGHGNWAAGAMEARHRLKAHSHNNTKTALDQKSIETRKVAITATQSMLSYLRHHPMSPTVHPTRTPMLQARADLQVKQKLAQIQSSLKRAAPAETAFTSAGTKKKESQHSKTTQPRGHRKIQKEQPMMLHRVGGGILLGVFGGAIVVVGEMLADVFRSRSATGSVEHASEEAESLQ